MLVVLRVFLTVTWVIWLLRGMAEGGQAWLVLRRREPIRLVLDGRQRRTSTRRRLRTCVWRVLRRQRRLRLVVVGVGWWWMGRCASVYSRRWRRRGSVVRPPIVHNADRRAMRSRRSRPAGLGRSYDPYVVGCWAIRPGACRGWRLAGLALVGQCAGLEGQSGSKQSKTRIPARRMT